METWGAASAAGYLQQCGGSLTVPWRWWSGRQHTVLPQPGLFGHPVQRRSSASVGWMSPQGAQGGTGGPTYPVKAASSSCPEVQV